MLNVTIQLDRIHCYAEDDSGSAEPYLWTVFFYLDNNTVLVPNHRIVTITPQSHSTTRNQYANGISAGDDLSIPGIIGEFDITLEDGPLDAMLAGVLFILIEEDETDFDAIRAGHKALEQSADFILNAFIESKVSADDKTPSGAEASAIANAISAEVKDAIEDAQGPWDYFDNQDDFLGFGFRFLAFDELTALAQSETGENISAFMAGKNYSWSVHGSIEVVDLDPPIGPFQDELGAYQTAVTHLLDVRKKIGEMEEDLQKVRGTTRVRKLTELKHLKNLVRPAAKKAVLHAHETYQKRLASVNPEILDSLRSREELRKARRQRLADTASSPFRREVKAVELRKEDYAEQKQ